MASSCVLLAERREQIAESGAPTRYPEAASTWKAAWALGAPKGCSGLAQILAVHLHQIQPIEPGALESLFVSQCQKGIKEACQVGRRGLELVLLRQRCSDGARITSASSCHELAHRADPAEALDTLPRLCQDGWRDERLAPELPAGCEQGAEPLVAYVESCRGGEARHCGFESLASQALARTGKECSTGAENSCALPGLYAWYGVGTAREPARAALAFEKGCSGAQIWGCGWLRELYADPTVLLPERASAGPATAPADGNGVEEEEGLEALLPAISPDGHLVAVLEEDCDLADDCTRRVRVFETVHGAQTGVRAAEASTLSWLRARGFRPMTWQQPPWQPPDRGDSSPSARVIAIDAGKEGKEEIWLREPGPGRSLLRRRVPEPLFGHPRLAECFGDFVGVSGTWYDPRAQVVLVVVDYTTMPDHCPDAHAYLVTRLESAARGSEDPRQGRHSIPNQSASEDASTRSAGLPPRPPDLLQRHARRWLRVPGRR